MPWPYENQKTKRPSKRQIRSIAKRKATRFAEEQITTLVKEADSALNKAEATDHLKLSRMERELLNKNLEREVYEVNSLVVGWTGLIPQAKLTESKACSRTLRKHQEKLG